MACDSDQDSDEAATETSQRTSLSLDAIFELLAHRQRRDMLRYLSDSPDNTATVDDVTSHLIDRESQRTSKQPGRDQIEIALHHVHLPKLTEADIIAYDPRSRELRYWPHDQLEALLEYVRSTEVTCDTL